MTQALTIKDDMSLMDLGNVLSKSGYFTDARDAAQAIVKVLAGREMGFGPIASMTGIYIVKGKPSMGANLIAAAVKRSGKYDYRVRTHTAEECSIEFYERSDGKRELIGVSTFTKSDAVKAGTQNIDKFPRNMLFARAMSNGAKWYCADVFGGPIYTPEELGATVDDEGEVIGGPKWNVITSEPAKPPIEQHNDLPTVDEVKAQNIGQPVETAMREPEAPAPSPAPEQSKTPVKKCVLKTGNFAAMLTRLQARTTYYNKKDGTIDGYHAQGAAAKCGYSEVTDENLESVFNDLVQYAIEQTLEIP